MQVWKLETADKGILIKVEFSQQAVKQLTTTYVPTAKFSPKLFKKVWWGDNSEEDYGVWHYLEDLPLFVEGMVLCTAISQS